MNVMPCPNCGQEVSDEYLHCPYCGANVATGERPTPDPKSRVAQTSGALTGAILIVAAYTLIGAPAFVSRNMVYMYAKLPLESRARWLFWATHGQWLTFAVPVAVTGLLYLLLRRRFPAFARGLFATFLVALVIALGAPFICGR